MAHNEAEGSRSVQAPCSRIGMKGLAFFTMERNMPNSIVLEGEHPSCSSHSTSSSGVECLLSLQHDVIVPEITKSSLSADDDKAMTTRAMLVEQ